MRQAVSQARQRLDCGDLSPLLSTSASQAASNSTAPRAKAPASWRSPNARARHGTRSKPVVTVLESAVARLGIIPGIVGPGGIGVGRPDVLAGQFGREPAGNLDRRRGARERAERGNAPDDVSLGGRV